MTSKISFSKLVRSEMRQMNWLLAVQMVAFVLFFPFRALMAMAMRQNELVSYGQAEYSAAEQFSRNVGLGNQSSTCVILCTGAVCALTAFYYIHSQTKQDFYHSLALKREELFAAKYISSIMTFLPAYLISQMLVILVGVFYQVTTPEIVLEILISCVQGLLFYLCSYSTTLVAVMLAGNLLTTVLGVGMFLGYLPILIMINESYRSVFFTASVDGTTAGRLIRLSWTSPWAWCLYATQIGQKGVTGMIPTIGNLCQLIAIAAVLTLISVALYRVRKTEAGGRALAFPITEPIIKILATVPVSLVAGLIVYQLVQSVPIEIICILLFGALVCAVIEFIYRVDIRQVFSHRLPFFISSLIAIAVFCVFRFDLTGYNTYLPAEEDLVSMSVSTYHTVYVNYDENGGIEYATSMRTRLDDIEWEDFDTIYQLAENGVEYKKKEEAAETVDYENLLYVYFKYHLKNGKEVYRWYPVDATLFYEAMNELIQNDEFRERYFSICTWDDDYMSRISRISCSIYDPEGMSLLEEDSGTEESETIDDAGGEPEDGAGTVAAAGTEGAAGTEDGAGTENLSEADSTDAVGTGADSGTEPESEMGEEEDYYYEDYYYEYYSVDMSVPLSRLSELVEAYREDLKTLSYEEIENIQGQIDFYFEGTYYNDFYTINEDFVNTMALLREIYKEQKE